MAGGWVSGVDIFFMEDEVGGRAGGWMWGVCVSCLGIWGGGLGNEVLKLYVQRVVPGILYQPGGAGGRGFSGVLELLLFIKPTVGSASITREKTCGMRAVRPTRKDSVGDILVDGESEGCRLTHVQKARREGNPRQLQVRERAGRESWGGSGWGRSE